MASKVASKTAAQKMPPENAPIKCLFLGILGGVFYFDAKKSAKKGVLGADSQLLVQIKAHLRKLG